jgi:hypothetical protein
MMFECEQPGTMAPGIAADAPPDGNRPGGQANQFPGGTRTR